MKKINNLISELKREILNLDLDSQIELLNRIKLEMHEISPFKKEPVDCVLWVKGDSVHANDYNPNSVAPPEMRLLEHSIEMDGYTQPIVTAMHSDIGKTGDDTREVIDGFHRNRVGKESEIVKSRIKGYLPVVTINQDRLDKNDRMAATVRHNRARGKHAVDSMTDMIIELKKRNWSNKKIGKELGMEPDEVLRLSQISGLAEAFADHDFSEAWEIVNE
jgi:ParB-like chromosome segregation protein Spo0J